VGDGEVVVVPKSWVDVQDLDTGRVAFVWGDLDIATAPQLRAAVDQALRQEHPRLIVDLGGCIFLDSSGVGALVYAVIQFRNSGSDEIGVRHLSSQTLRMLERMGLDTFLPLPSDGDTVPPVVADDAAERMRGPVWAEPD
jgi:anti-sigma B factor antagonist